MPDEGDSVSQEALVVAVHAKVPAPVFVIWIVCPAGAVPPVVVLNSRLTGDTAIIDGLGKAAKIVNASVPEDVITVIVDKPTKLAGRVAVIAVLFQELT